jgi:hypothetical protein
MDAPELIAQIWNSDVRYAALPLVISQGFGYALFRLLWDNFHDL